MCSDWPEADQQPVRGIILLGEKVGPKTEDTFDCPCMSLLHIALDTVVCLCFMTGHWEVNQGFPSPVLKESHAVKRGNTQIAGNMHFP